MKASKQNKDGDLIFEAYTSKVNPSPKLDAVIAEAGAKKAAVKGATKTVKSPEAKSWARGAGDWLRKKFGRKEAKPPTKAETAALNRADRAAKKAAVDAEKAAKKKALDKQKAKDLKNKPMTAAAKKNLELKGAERVAALGRAGDTAKAAVKPLAIGTAALATPVVGYHAGKAVIDTGEEVARNLPGKLGLGDPNKPAVAGAAAGAQTAAEMGYTPGSQEFVDQVEKGKNAAILAAKLDGPTSIFKNQETGNWSPGRLAAGAGVGIAGKLAYDAIANRKKEKEKARRRALYTASYNPQQTKSGYDII